ncbi:MAG: YhfC family intramembrane metalloprotease [Candidatus Nealsonbacteria bacterium]|nr:YhfC family intramembrane metalloprotease [Candidatus Nealsonbacteria bacterium]
MNNVKKFVPMLVAVIIFSVAARLLIRFVENTFNLDIDPLVRILIIGLSVVIAISIVNVKLAKKTKEGAKNGIKISRFSLIPGLIPGIGMLIVAAVPTLWILNLGAEWSVVRLGTFAWAASVALKIAWAVLAHKPILNFLKTKLPTKLSGPISWSYIGLLTGIFECGIALVFVLKFNILYQATWIDILAFGIGFGAFEAFAVGVVSLSQIGQYLLRPESIPEKYRKEKEEEESTLNNLSMLLVGPVERVSTLLIHVFSNVLIILAVQQNIYLLFWLSFGFKTLVDGIAGWLTLEKDAENVTKASQAWAHQAIFIVLGLISVAGIVLLQKIWYS